MKLLKATFLLLACVAMLSSPTYSTEIIRPVKRLTHSGDIIGMVFVCNEDKGLPDVLVYIPGESFMVKTDLNGHFRLYNIPKGSYDL